MLGMFCLVTIQFVTDKFTSETLCTEDTSMSQAFLFVQNMVVTLTDSNFWFFIHWFFYSGVTTKCSTECKCLSSGGKNSQGTKTRCRNAPGNGGTVS